MDNEPSGPVPPELRVVMDMEIQLQEPVSYADQQKLESQLLAVPGVESLNFLENGLAIRYDPETVTRASLCGSITQAGFRVSDVESASSSPTVEPPSDNR